MTNIQKMAHDYSHSFSTAKFVSMTREEVHGLQELAYITGAQDMRELASAKIYSDLGGTPIMVQGIRTLGDEEVESNER